MPATKPARGGFDTAAAQWFARWRMRELPSRAEIVARACDRGERIAAVMPIHYPRALLRAHGFYPIEVWGPPEVDPIEGNAHFQAYTCAIVRNAASFLVQGGLDVASVLLVPHTCDALQGMASVLIDFMRPKQKVCTLYLPRREGPSATKYLAAELQRLGEELAAISGRRPDDAELLEAVEREEAADRALAELARGRDRVDLSARDYFSLLRSREYLPAEDFIEAAEAAPRGARSDDGVALMISGIVPEPMDLFDQINAAGARIVADDLACCSRRLYPPGESQAPYVRMAESLLDCPADPTRGSTIPTRSEELAQRMRELGARGLLVYDPKFCEPELFDLPQLRRHLAAFELPLLHVEFEMGGSLSNQALTRIEAFVETLQ